MNFLEFIDRLDKALVYLVNHDSDSAILDQAMLLLRNPLTWIPLYGLLAVYAIKKMQGKSIRFFLMSLVCFAITDSISFWILKPLFHRLRPCHDAALSGLIRPLLDCGGSYSLPSSHAANHFGLAVFWWLAIRYVTGRRWSWLFIWAAAICYAQVYVGKHYPSDIALGALFGSLTGYLVFLLFRQWWQAGEMQIAGFRSQAARHRAQG